MKKKVFRHYLPANNYHTLHIVKILFAGFLLIPLLTLICNAQNKTDSLKKILATTTNDTLRLTLLNSLVEEIAEDTVWTAYNEEMGDLALEVLKNADSLTQLTAKKYLAAYYNNLGFLQQDIGNNIQALNYYHNSRKIYENIHDKNGIANALNIIGTVYYDQQEMEQALQYYKKSLAMMEDIKDTFGMATALNNMGSVYNTRNETINAIQRFEQCIELRKQIDDKEGLGITLTNLGGLYDKANENEKALIYYKQSLEVQEETGDMVGIAYSRINFGNIYLKNKNYRIAENYFLAARGLATKTGNAAVMLGAANYLSKLYAAWGKYKPAFEMQALYKQMTDSIRNDETKKQTLIKQIQFEYEKKEAILKAEQEKKDVIAREEIARQKIIRNATAGIAIILMTSATMILVFYKRKKEAEMQNKITDSRMRAINSQMNPHFIFNCMQSIQSMVAKQDLAGADHSLVRFAKLIRKVLDNSTQKEITLQEDMDTLRDYVELEKMRLDYPLDFLITIDEDIQPDELLIPPLLIQPIIENAIIHGIKPKYAAGAIHVEIKKKQNLMAIEISDNGVGRKPSSEGKSSRKSYGIPLTRERLDYLGKSMNMKLLYKIDDIYGNNYEIRGTKVRLTIPLHHEFS